MRKDFQQAADNRAGGGEQIDQIMQKPLMLLRLELKNAVAEQKFTQEQYDEFVEKLSKIKDISHQVEIARTAIETRSVNSELDIELDKPEKQLLWAAVLTRMRDAGTSDMEGGGKLAHSRLWKQLLNSMGVHNEGVRVARVISIAMGNRDVTFDWGQPGSWFYFDATKNHINLDLFYMLLNGFEHTRTIHAHEIGHSQLTNVYPPRMQELYKKVEKLVDPNNTAQQIYAQMTPEEQKQLARDVAEWNLWKEAYNAMEDVAIDQFTANLSINGEVPQDFVDSLNHAATILRGFGETLRGDDAKRLVKLSSNMPSQNGGSFIDRMMNRKKQQDDQKEAEEAVKKLTGPLSPAEIKAVKAGQITPAIAAKMFSRITEAAFTSFYEYSGLISGDDPIWNRLRNFPEDIRQTVDVSAIPEAQGMDSFEYFRELCIGNDESLRTLQPRPQDKIMLRDGFDNLKDSYQAAVAETSLHRGELMQLIWDIYLKRYADVLIQDYSKEIEKGLKTPLPPNQAPSPMKNQQDNANKAQQDQNSSNDNNQPQDQQKNNQQNQNQQQPQNNNQPSPQNQQQPQNSNQQKDQQQPQNNNQQPQQSQQSQNGNENQQPQDQSGNSQESPQSMQQESKAGQDQKGSKGQEQPAQNADSHDQSDTQSQNQQKGKGQNDQGQPQQSDQQGQGEKQDLNQTLKEDLSQMTQNPGEQRQKEQQQNQTAQSGEKPGADQQQNKGETQGKGDKSRDQQQEGKDQNENGKEQNGKDQGNKGQDGKDSEGRGGPGWENSPEMQKQLSQPKKAKEEAQRDLVREEISEEEKKAMQEAAENSPQQPGMNPQNSAGHTKGVDMAKLAKGNWRDYNTRMIELSPEVNQVVRSLEQIRKEQRRQIAQMSKSHDYMPDDGDFQGRLDRDKVVQRKFDKLSGKKMTEDSYKNFYEDKVATAESTIEIVFMIDGSGSMPGVRLGEELNAVTAMEAAIQSAAIGYEAALKAGIDAYICIWGDSKPIVIATPKTNRREVGAKLESLRQGTRSGTDFAPGLAEGFETIADHKNDNGTISGSTHFIYYSDGDITDSDAAQKMLNNLASQFRRDAKNISIDVAVLRPPSDHSVTDMEKCFQKVIDKNGKDVVGIIRGSDPQVIPIEIARAILRRVKRVKIKTEPDKMKRDRLKRVSKKLNKKAA